jgi:hypothetical protein
VGAGPDVEIRKLFSPELMWRRVGAALSREDQV